MEKQLKQELKEIKKIGKRYNTYFYPFWKKIFVSMFFIMIFDFAFLGIFLWQWDNINTFTFEHTNQKLIEEYQNQSVINEVFEDCKDRASNRNKVECVNYYAIEHFKYTNVKYIRNPQSTIEDGGDCKAWNLFYRTALNRLNIKTKDIISKGHIFTLAHWEHGYCTIDQTRINCESLK